MNADPVPEELGSFFAEHPKIALAFSGGTDSSYLFYAAAACGVDVSAYYLRSQFQPAHGLSDAERTARALGQPLNVIEADILADPSIAANPPGRCYLCKKHMFGRIREAARGDGYPAVMDGTNASDRDGERPGMRVLGEMHILSPLRDAGLAKSDVRELSRRAGLWTWDLAPCSCLATRCEEGVPITEALLRRTDECEMLISGLGFGGIRVRTEGNGAVLEIRKEQEDLLREHKMEVEKILLEHYGSADYAYRGPPL